MKKTIFVSVLSMVTAGVFAQAGLDNQLRDAQCKSAADEITKGEKASQDAKKGAKSSTWVKLAAAYEDMAINCGKDSMASEKAYNTYKKALEVEAGGKGAKEIEAALTSQKIYSALMQQGAGFYNAKNFPNALRLFRLASEVSPKDTTAALYSGIVGQQAKDNEAAKVYFAKFIDQGGKDPAVFYSLSEIYKAEKNNTKAVEVLKKGISANPNDKDLKGSLVNIQLSSGNSDEAIAELKKLIDADPNNVNNLLNLAILYDNGGKKEEALVWYKKVLAIDPNNYDCNFNLGVYYFNQAVEIKKEVDKMDMKEYQKNGKAVEDKACAKFAEAKPYFDICKAAREKEGKPQEEELTTSMTSLTSVLEQCAKRK
ncbi:lipopolysaccharide assembly protein LapB [Emticicia sp. C21]|uniref:tetratricopeptide repeat protein n=1 Tax=Emticicia sp. C21 TaxID=2302915 RepID=UPI000E3441D2|nr:tetratricopeptide repeat protein [Emticicia sp. C21]RFS14600.1 tetratricopeptide repeat protein [Emticicia sp. C21]